MNPACLLGRHEWHQVASPTRDNRTAQQCRRCGKTEEAEARDSAECGSPELRFVAGGRAWVPFGILVAALAVPVWLAAPDGASGMPYVLVLLIAGYGFAAYRREVRVDRDAGKLVQRLRILPFTISRHDLRPHDLRKLQLTWQRRPGSRAGSRQHVQITALGPHMTLQITRQSRPKRARAIAAEMADVLDLAVEDRTREPGAPGT